MADKPKVLTDLDDANARAQAVREDTGTACADHWHCDPELAAHRCDRPIRARPCPSCDEHPAPVPTPELDRRGAIKAQLADPTETVGQFLDWLSDNGIRLARYVETRPGLWTSTLVEIADSTDRLMAEHFGLDLNKIDREQRAVLRRIQDQNRR